MHGEVRVHFVTHIFSFVDDQSIPFDSLPSNEKPELVELNERIFFLLFFSSFFCLPEVFPLLFYLEFVFALIDETKRATRVA